ncbi:MAG: GHMP family kinase ATP-binding protein [Ilumatobacteraceae bacterium]
MIITRTPLRISLGGGGTDLPSYYREAGHGFLIAAAITKYVYIAVNQNFGDHLLLKYSQIERVPKATDVVHPLLRECLLSTGTYNGVEISSMADIPTGTGLGSSGAFTVGVLKALRTYAHQSTSNLELAAEACAIEIERLGEPVGKQDQYISANGGITAFTFHDDERVEVERLELSPATRASVEDNLALFYTGVQRSASDVLAEEQSSASSDMSGLRDNLDRTRAIGYETRDALLADDLEQFGALLTDQWALKYARQRSATHDRVDSWIRAGIKAGAAGGKLVGAGGGGFLLFYAERKKELRAAMREFGLDEVRFRIDYEGSTAIVVL